MPLETGAHGGEFVVLAVPNGHHEVGPDERHDLTDLDDLTGGGEHLVGAVTHRLEDDEEQVVAVGLQLGALVRVHRVLDGERVQPELLRDLGEVVLAGIREPDPHEAATRPHLCDGCRQRRRSVDAPALSVDRAADDRVLDDRRRVNCLVVKRVRSARCAGHRNLLGLGR